MTTGIAQLDMMVGAGLATLLPVIFTMGLMSGLSPCSIPTVALVVGYVSKANNQGRVHGFWLSVCFVLGVALVLTILGGGGRICGRPAGAKQALVCERFYRVKNVSRCGLCTLYRLGPLDA